MGHQAVVGADGAGLCAAAAKIAAIGQFRQARHQGPVQLNVPILPGAQQAAMLHVFVVEAAQDFRTIGGAVDFVASAGLKMWQASEQVWQRVQCSMVSSSGCRKVQLFPW